ncbi:MULTISPECIES: hypothetical protein [Clostridium]|uniref:hypothetical protein n=1 Tax=Clostridium TaxID=1485 RepID=UPI0004D84E0E|nr:MULTISPECIES: hypothetical protein [Clostridium]KEH89547.1 hypothetical protein Z967_08135 [Clostridium novyi A str. 4540]KEH96839.1 hypothetical protein Z962_05580 [Clostridium botulinum C/D str. BKT12695]
MALDINITEIIINQLRYGTMDKEEIRKKVDVMYFCNAFSEEDYKRIIAVYEEVTKKADKIEDVEHKETEHTA